MQKREVTETEFDKDMRKTDESSCDATLQHSTALPERERPQPNTATRLASTYSAPVSPLPQSLVRPSSPGGVFDIAPCDNSPSTAGWDDNNTRGSSNPLTDLDSIVSIDGPTIAVEQPSVEQKKNADATSSVMPVTIDLTGDTPSPIHLPSSPVVSRDGTSENTSSSVLDLTDTKYRDFDVPLDSSFCLPSIRTSVLKRSPTPPPPRTKPKNVTFALPPEEVDEEQLETLEAPVEAIAPVTWNETNELEYLESAFGPPRDDGSSSSVDSLGLRVATKPQEILPSPTFYSRVRKAAQAGPSLLLSSPVTLRRNRPRLSRATLSTAADPKHRHSAQDASLSPAMVEPMALRNYLDSVMVLLDEIHAIVKSNVQSRFDSVTSDVAKLRKQIIAQTQADMSALLDEYITAFNNLVNLEAKYGAFSKRRIAAFTQARNANAQGIASLRAHIQAHDHATQVYFQRALVIEPLPASVRRWL
ncbi:hypothetical protein H4582DRAFT_611812 [Lactarius indigo]|nr:hypothetical protein H4582DRAFT_611812 [Lactarius indigo]